jgi:hypothetical protein
MDNSNILFLFLLHLLHFDIALFIIIFLIFFLLPFGHVPGMHLVPLSLAFCLPMDMFCRATPACRILSHYPAS